MFDLCSTGRGTSSPPGHLMIDAVAKGEMRGETGAGVVTPSCDNERAGRCVNSPGTGHNPLEVMTMAKIVRYPGALYCPSDDGCERGHLDDWCSSMRAVALAYLTENARHEPPPVDPLALPVEGPCWVGVGHHATKGYWEKGIGRRGRRVHRLALAAVGMRLEGLSVDHLCRNRACCNPAHLEPVSVVENTMRGALVVPVTHCIRGHEFTEENTGSGIDPRSGRPYRWCLTCKRMRDGKRDRRHRYGSQS